MLSNVSKETSNLSTLLNAFPKQLFWCGCARAPVCVVEKKRIKKYGVVFAPKKRGVDGGLNTGEY